MNWKRSNSSNVLAALGLSGGLLAGAAGAAGAAYAQTMQSYNVRLVNWAIEGAPAQVRAGQPLTFNATSSGLPHTLAIDGNNVNLPSPVPPLQDGQTGAITFQGLQPGTYNLYCPVGNGVHRERGMNVQFTVVAGAANLPATGAAPLPGSLPAGLAAAGLAVGAAGVALRRRTA